MNRIKLRELAHSRTGDKGDTSNISVVAFRAEDYQLLCQRLTIARVTEHFSELLGQQNLPIRRYELPNVYALNFVLPGVLRGGVTRSLALDAHGKTLGAALLDLTL
ncbi:MULTISPECIES: hypothetical protein [Pseudomonas]|uniref:AtuA-like ferredoxin-fold domain-containing protein n=1 Tax=Pseudomonas vancouverensis TaxID=95300 RepID=A0A1H2MDD4_PSEVA|nr:MULTISPECIES: hypothetical protein [Pseudomonas]KAB0499108.1 hypothetical protein F7R09_07310 [Pseudomonas vancouverensis]TDB57804.1 hypothetical protein EIY72_26480 [Pseudomonas vancouverensis]SDU91084.1 hypothetical protein SAMN05216558_0579 [Pseudomonas vancouverensis]